MTDHRQRPPLPLSKSPIRLPDGVIEVDERGNVIGTAVRQCYGTVHVFAERPGACQCGTEFWGWDDPRGGPATPEPTA